jgi:hypothetical protein
VARGRRAPAGGRAQHPDRHVRRRGLRPPEHLRRRDQHADAVAPGRGRHRLQPLPHHGHVLADAGGADDRPQPPSGGRGSDRRVRQRLGRLHRRDSEVVGDHRRGAAPLRLCDGRLRQGPQHADRPDRQRPLRPYADGPRLRLLLRLHRGRDLAVGAHAVGEHHADLAAARGELRGLPPDRGHGRQGDHLDAAPPRHEPGSALPDVVDARRRARSPSCRQGVGGQVQGQVRRRLGRLPGAGLRATEGHGLDPRRHQAGAPRPEGMPPGKTSPTTRRRSRPG